jgi:hypothetical protein
MSSLFFENTTLRWDLLLQFRNDVFIETGTFKGQGILTALQCGFKEIHSIEIDSYFYDMAKERYKENKNVHLHLGDSADVLWSIIEKIEKPITFWLDGHWEPGYTVGRVEVPIIEELAAIRNHPIKTHSILIDDINQAGVAPNPEWKAKGKCWQDISLETIIENLKKINPYYKIDFGDHPSPRGAKYAVLLAYTDRTNVNDIQWRIDFEAIY